MILHIISKTKGLTEFNNLIIKSGEKDSIIFIGEGVYCLLQDKFINYLKDSKSKIYIIKSDLIAKGINIKEIKNLNYIDYADFVKLIVTYPKSITW